MNGANTKPDLDRAIRRARRSRAALRSRRRRSALLAGLAAALLGSAALWSIGALSGNDMVEAAVSNAKVLADLIDQRSPGARTQAELTKTKHAQALAKLRPAARPRALHLVEAKIATDDLAALVNALPVPPVGEAPASLPPLDLAPPSIGTIVAPPSGNSPPGGLPPSTLPPASPPIVPVPPAVPEPRTWATMLLGFALVGSRIRSSRRKRSLRPA